MRPDITHLTRATMAALGMSFPIDDVTGYRKTKALVDVRHLAMWLVRRCTGMSYPEIAMQFDRVDHSGTRMAVMKIDRLIERHPDCFMAETAVRLERQHHPMHQVKSVVSTGARLLTLPAVGGTVELDLEVSAAE